MLSSCIMLLSGCMSDQLELEQPQSSTVPCEVAHARPMKKVQVRKMQFSSCRQSWHHWSP